MMGFGIGRMGLAFRGPRPVPSWVAPGAAFHIKPASGWAWINGREYTSFAALVADPTAASYARPSECYALTSAGTFTRFDSGVPAITDLGLLVEGEETAVGNYSIQPEAWGLTGTRVVVTQNQAGATSFDAIKIQGDAASGSHSIAGAQTNFLFTTGKTYLMYVIAEALSGGYLQLVAASAAFGSQVYANFDMTGNGALGTKGTSTTSSGIVKLANGRFLMWIIGNCTSTANGTLTFALVPSSNSVRLASSNTTASVIISGYQISNDITRWGSPINIEASMPLSRAAVNFNIMPLSGNYDITYKFSDVALEQAVNSVAIAGGNYSIPTNLNGRFVVDIVGVTA